jgi:uncharacterized DUF497 family protein
MLILTKHAKERIRERGISLKDIKKTLLNPDQIFRENRKIIASKKINKKILEIIYVIENNKKIILTCYYQ